VRLERSLLVLNERCWVGALTLTVAVAALTVTPATAGIIHIDRSACVSAAPHLAMRMLEDLAGTPAYPRNHFNGSRDIDLVFSSMGVGDPQAPAASRPAEGASGLYFAPRRRLVFRATGGTDWISTTEFYLLSPEGRVYRGYDLPEVPGGDLRRFDYEQARRADPGNSGSYTTSGNAVTITVGGESISATLAGPDELEIRGTKFKRSVK
jgi:hypothetical protein